MATVPWTIPFFVKPYINKKNTLKNDVLIIIWITKLFKFFIWAVSLRNKEHHGLLIFLYLSTTLSRRSNLINWNASQTQNEEKNRKPQDAQLIFKTAAKTTALILTRQGLLLATFQRCYYSWLMHCLFKFSPLIGIIGTDAVYAEKPKKLQ